MGTTINGTYIGGRKERQRQALKRLENAVANKKATYERELQKAKEKKKVGEQFVDVAGLTDQYNASIARMQNEITILKTRV